MNKFILLAGFCLLGIIVSFQSASTIRTYQISSFSSNPEDSILWNKNRKLIWDDFKGKPDHTDIAAAFTVSSVSMNFDIYKDSIIYIYVNNRFLTTKSWVKKEQIYSLLLEHEQGHFNLSEIRARKIRKGLSNYISKNKDLTIKFIYSVYNEQTRQCDILDNEYDEQTVYGSNDNKQKEWTAKIAKMLNELEAFSSSEVVIKRVGW